MSISRIIVAGALTTVLAASTAHAGGIGLNDFGARASGRGAAMVAEKDDPSAIYFNPANMVYVPGLSIDVTLGGVSPKYQYTPYGGGASTSTKTTVVPVPALSAVYNLGDLGKLGEAAIGVGFYVPMGSGFEWPAGWAGYQSIEKIQLQVFEVAPAISWRPGKKWSIGAGFRYLPSQVYMSRGVSFGSDEPTGSLQLKGSGTAYGWNAGITVLPTDFLTIGFAYRSGPTLKMKGDAQFDFPAPFDTAGLGNKVEANIGTAAYFKGGFQVQAIPDRLKLAVDIERGTWSNLKALDITFTKPDGTKTTTPDPRRSVDSWTLHFGGELALTKEWLVRAGYIYDEATLPESTVNPAPPDSDQHVISLGLSYMLGNVGGMKNFGIHLYFENVFLTPRTVVANVFQAEYKGGFAGSTDAYLFGIGVGGSFDVGGNPKWAPAAK